MTLSNAKWSCAPHGSPACAKGVDKGPYQTPLQTGGNKLIVQNLHLCAAVAVDEAINHCLHAKISLTPPGTLYLRD